MEDALNATHAAAEERIVPRGNINSLSIKKASRISNENPVVLAGIRLSSKVSEADSYRPPTRATSWVSFDSTVRDGMRFTRPIGGASGEKQ